eukprot:7506228-Prorocentrum_lima.AAC.1
MNASVGTQLTNKVMFMTTMVPAIDYDCSALFVHPTHHLTNQRNLHVVTAFHLQYRKTRHYSHKQ